MKIICSLVVMLTIVGHSFAQDSDIRTPPNATIMPLLGSQLDLDLEFTESTGKRIKLAELFLPGKPALIMPVYYECPRLCGLIMNGVLEMLQEQTLELGKDYSIITYSINPKENYELAAKKKLSYKKELEPSGKDVEGWHFLVGDEITIRAVSASLGFNFLPEGEKDYAHGAAVFVLTNKGKLSQYFTGIVYAARDVRLALVEASSGLIGNSIDHVMLLCSSFDPKTGQYNWAVARLLQITGAFMILFVGGIIAYFVLREQKQPGHK